MVIPGIILAFVAMLGGFMLSKGNPMALLQGAEFITIGGVALGAMVTATPMKVLKLLAQKITHSIKGKGMTRQAYLDLLTVMFKLFAVARKSGELALEPHISDPHKSDILSKYPSVLHHKAGLELLLETLRLIVDGSAQPDELERLMSDSIDTFEAEEHMPINSLRNVGDGLPGIGIVGAVLGIIITMGHIDGKAAEVGEHVASALVGTLVGVFSAYGIINPVCGALTHDGAEETNYLTVIKTSISAFFGGSSPSVAIEFGRRAIFSFDRPTVAEVEVACKK